MGWGGAEGQTLLRMGVELSKPRPLLCRLPCQPRPLVPAFQGS